MLSAKSIWEVERLLRAGHGESARTTLLSLSSGAHNLSQATCLASLARRLGLPELGLRLLHSRLLFPPPGEVCGKDAAYAEYAACLIRAGAVEEGLELLGRFSPARVPLVDLFTAFARISQWEYAKAIVPLTRFVSRPTSDSYLRLVGEVNLAAAQVFEARFAEAESRMDRLFEEIRREGYDLLRGSVQLIRAQSLIARTRYGEARDLLHEARVTLAQAGTEQGFFVRKWLAIADRMESPQNAKALHCLTRLRREAEERGHWESLRQCDRVEALASGQESLFWHVFFGTPFPRFRGALLADRGLQETPTEYLRLFGEADGQGPVLGLDAGEVGGKKRFRPGGITHRLLIALASDFYRPLRVATLHSLLYRGERYNPISSPPRIHMAVCRLRRELSAIGFPLDISAGSSGYRLLAKSPCGIRMAFGSPRSGKEEILLAPLRQSHPGSPFSAHQLRELLPYSPRRLRRLLARAREAGIIEKLGQGRQTRYRFRASGPIG